MYDWLSDALAGESSCIVTANRRLSRELVSEFSKLQLESGATAWRRPKIFYWAEWLSVLADRVPPQLLTSARINAQQSRVLWEQCLQKDIDDPLVSEASLARLCRDTWLRLHEWRVPLKDCQSRAAGQDQRIFARAAGHYQRVLETNNWIDDALLPASLAELFEGHNICVDETLTLAGFDRVTPQARRLVDAVIRCGGKCLEISSAQGGKGQLIRFANPDDELRAAGRWARIELERSPELRIGVVVNDLDNGAERTARLLRDGFVPGWQYGHERLGAAINVSYGRRLSDYPSVHTAILALRWLSEDLNSADVSVLLRSPFLGNRARHGRSKFELRFREWPDRRWSRDLLLRALAKAGEKDKNGDGADWLRRITEVGEMLDETPGFQSPALWAGFFDRALDKLNWPGDGSLNSVDFQLTNRWRDMLNEFSRLALVNAQMDVGSAVRRLTTICAESIFQPESGTPSITVLGTLEAAGMQFDKLWVTGLTAENWPANAKPLVLVSRDLQVDFGMPDATPDDTTDYAERVLMRLGNSAEDIKFSYPALIGDADQIASPLIDGMIDGNLIEEGDAPGWHAVGLLDTAKIDAVPDRVPIARPGEAISGGAGTINRQCSDPFSAFAYGRLAIRWLPRFVGGIPANVRGNLIHDALRNLYQDKPSRDDIVEWAGDELEARIGRAVESAFARQFSTADDVLKRLLRLEQGRTAGLLQTVVAIDRERTPFSIVSVEDAMDATLSGANFKLRCDRIDAVEGDQLVILDYKTGRTRKFLVSGGPDDMQLVIYALAVKEPIAGLGLFNVDSKVTEINGVGPALRPIDDWEATLEHWQAIAREAADQITSGDVRLNVRQNTRDARPLSLLSRYAELHLDD